MTETPNLLGFGPNSATVLSVLEEKFVLTSPPHCASVSPTKTEGEKRPGSMSIPTKIWRRGMQGKNILLINYPAMSASPSKFSTGSEVSGRASPAVLGACGQSGPSALWGDDRGCRKLS